MTKIPVNVCKFLFIYLFLGYSFILSNKLLAQRIQIITPQQIEEGVNKKNILSKEAFYNYPFTGEVIDLKEVQRRNPHLGLPKSIQIILPDLSEIRDTSLLIGVLKNNQGSAYHLVILIAGDYETNEVTFFADTNLDHDYRNDGAPFVLIGGADAKSVFLHPAGEKALKLTLSVPKRLSRIEQKVKELKTDNKKIKTRISNKIAIGLAMGAGIGKLRYNYDNLSLGYPTWYNVRFSEKAIKAMLSYDLPKFRIGIDASFINHYYYTSYLNVRFAEPKGVKTGVLTERNIDKHVLNRWQIGLTAAYRIRLSRFSELQPIVTYGKNFYFSDVYYSDNRPRKENAYNLSPNTYFEYGAQIEFTTGYQKVFLFNVVINNLSWKPDDFAAELEIQNLTTKHASWKIMFGYRFAF